MHDTEREVRAIERAIQEAIGSEEDPGVRHMARAVGLLMGLRAGKAKVIVAGQTPVVRVLMTGRGARRTVTAGIVSDAFSQIVGPALSGIRPDLLPRAVGAVRAAVPDVAARMADEVKKAVERLLSSPEEVAKWKKVMADGRADRARLEKENLVSKMTALLSDGWTMEQLNTAVADATCRHVMSS